MSTGTDDGSSCCEAEGEVADEDEDGCWNDCMADCCVEVIVPATLLDD